MSPLLFILVSLVFAFTLTFMIMPYGIRLLYQYRIGKNIRSEGLIGKAEEFSKLHGKKQGTPTMGGLIMLFVVGIIILISIGIQALEPQMQAWFGVSF